MPETQPKPEHEPPSDEQIENDHLSPDTLIGLGRQLLSYDLAFAQYLTKNEPSDEALEMVLQAQRETETVGVSHVRSKLESLNEEQTSAVNWLMSRASRQESAWLQKVLDVNESDDDQAVKNYVERLTAKDKSGKYEISDELVLEFCRWHNYELAGEQKKLNEQKEDFKKYYKDHFKQAKENGWIPENSLNHLDRFDTMRLVVDDGFETSAHAESKSGIYLHLVRENDDSEHTIMFSPESLEKNPYKILLHEGTHAMQGQGLMSAPGEGAEDMAERLRQKTDGMNRLFGNGSGGNAIDEAVVEHFALSMQSGEIDIIDPEKKAPKESAYIKERKLLAALCEAGEEPVDIQLFLAAFFEDVKDDQLLGEKSANEKLRKKLKKAFPFTDVIKEINDLEIDTEEDTELYAELLGARAMKHRN